MTALLVDTSAWVEYLRATGSVTHHEVRRLLQREGPLHTTDVLVMEVLAGGRDEAHAARLRAMLARCEFVPTAGLADYEQAAWLYRRCRRAGETVRALNDCLIASVAIRKQLTVLHNDHDFEVIARHTELQARSGPDR